MATHLPLVLGSSSVFRQQQLRQLGLNFISASPNFDETPQAHETAEQTALRLARGKAQSLSTRYPNHLIIGADQVAYWQQRQLGKPMTHDLAVKMLRQLSGQTIEFYSAICLLNSQTGNIQQHVDCTQVHMRPLSDQHIHRYLQREPDAIYCAGSAKSEGLGAVLIQQMHTSDPNALIGLPIFRLVDFLLAENVDILTA